MSKDDVLAQVADWLKFGSNIPEKDGRYGELQNILDRANATPAVELLAALGGAAHYHVIVQKFEDAATALRFGCPAPWPPTGPIVLAKNVRADQRCGRVGCRNRWGTP